MSHTLSKITQSRWNKLCHALSIAPDPHEFRRLHAAYSESHRRYHSLQHLEECLHLLDMYVQAQPVPPELIIEGIDEEMDYSLVEMALWYHDAIYQPMAKHNERNSAQWAIDFLQRSGAKTNICEQVDTLIMTTRHETDAPSYSANQRLLKDIDLAILGEKSERFMEYEQQVRAEYQAVPHNIYVKKRCNRLQDFLGLQRIYQTDWFYSIFEQQARENLANSIHALLA